MLKWQTNHHRAKKIGTFNDCSTLSEARQGFGSRMAIRVFQSDRHY
jgi:hypothetical protein